MAYAPIGDGDLDDLRRCLDRPIASEGRDEIDGRHGAPRCSEQVGVEDLAGDYLARIVEAPELAEDGRVIVRDDEGAEIARLNWPA